MFCTIQGKELCELFDDVIWRLETFRTANSYCPCWGVGSIDTKIWKHYVVNICCSKVIFSIFTCISVLGKLELPSRTVNNNSNKISIKSTPQSFISEKCCCKLVNMRIIHVPFGASIIDTNSNYTIIRQIKLGVRGAQSSALKAIIAIWWSGSAH